LKHFEWKLIVITELKQQSKPLLKMITLNLTRKYQEEITSMVRSGRIPKPEYLDEYKEWARRFEQGHSIAQIVEHTEATDRVVKQGLYAMDLLGKRPTDVAPSTEKDMIEDYYVEKVSQLKLAGRYGLHERKPSWIVRCPALRLMIESEVEPVREMNGKGTQTARSSGSDGVVDVDDTLEKWKRKNGKSSASNGNYSARVKTTSRV